MKYTTLLLLFVVPIFAAEPTVPEKEVPKDFTSLLIEKADKYSDKAVDGLSKAYDTLEVEAKATIEEFVRWRFVMHSIYVVTWFIFSAVPAAYMTKVMVGQIKQDLAYDAWREKALDVDYHERKEWVKNNPQPKKMSDILPVTAAVTLVLIIVFSSTLCFLAVPELLKAIQACTAPRIYVIEAALEVMKSR